MKIVMQTIKMGVFHLKNKRFKVFCLFDMSGLMEAHVIRGSYRLLLIIVVCWTRGLERPGPIR